MTDQPDAGRRSTWTPPGSPTSWPRLDHGRRDRGGDPTKSYVYANKAFVAVDTGFEVQLDDLARGDPARGIPDGLDQHHTGAIYDIPIGAGTGQQTYTKPPPLTPLTWHALELRVTGDQYTVSLDGNQTSTFTNTNPARGQPGTPDLSTGFLGVQSHTGRVAFRNIRLQRLPLEVGSACRGQMRFLSGRSRSVLSMAP
jgi:Domain of Unknown Function (DUF1080)